MTIAITTPLDRRSKNRRATQIQLIGLVIFALINIGFAAITSNGLTGSSIMSAGSVALIEAILFQNLSRARLPAMGCAMALVCTSPLILWSASNAGNEGIELILYWLLTRSMIGLIRHRDVRSIINMGFCLAASLLLGGNLNYIVLVLSPFLFFLAPPDMIRKAPGSFLLLVFFPAAVTLAGYLYANMRGVFPKTGLLNRLNPQSLLMDHNELLLRPLLSFLEGTVIAFPLSIIAPFMLRAEKLIAMPLAIAVIVPILAAVAATITMSFNSPTAMLVLLAAPMMQAVVELISRRKEWLAIGLLAIGWVGQAATLTTVMMPDIHHWTQSLSNSYNEIGQP